MRVARRVEQEHFGSGRLVGVRRRRVSLRPTTSLRNTEAPLKQAWVKRLSARPMGLTSEVQRSLIADATSIGSLSGQRKCERMLPRPGRFRWDANNG